MFGSAESQIEVHVVSVMYVESAMMHDSIVKSLYVSAGIPAGIQSSDDGNSVAIFLSRKRR